MGILVLDNRNLEASVEEIRKHLEEPRSFGVFIEVTNQKVTDFTRYYPTFWIDPQHTVTGKGGLPELLKNASEFTEMSASRWVVDNYRRLCELLADRDILYVLEKVDMDAMAALVLCQWIEELGEDLEVSDDTVQRVVAIHDVDTFVVPTDWDPTYIKPYEVKWTNILGSAVSDFKQPILSRIGYMIDYLLEGKLPEYYRGVVEKEWQLLQQATVEEMSGITVVTSDARGASGVIYSNSPYGIAYCKNFNGKGTKFSVMQFKSGYLRMHDFYTYMNANYPDSSGTWGGGPNAGGSPIPCYLSKEVVASELAKFVVKKV